MRRHRSRVSNFAAGAIAAVVILAVCYLVFGGGLPFAGSPFTLRRRSRWRPSCTSARRCASPGSTSAPSPRCSASGGSSSAAVATMSIQSSGLPIHADATADIRPRLFLEGNFYVDLHPGTPNAPAVSSGATLPASQTTGPGAAGPRPVGAALQHAAPTCRRVLQGLGAVVQRPADRRPGRHPGSERAGADRRGSRSTSRSSTPPARSGPRRSSTPRCWAASLTISRAWSPATRACSPRWPRAQTQLADLVTTFNATMGALAARQQDLSTTISLLPPLLHAADSALGPLQASFGPTQRFAAALTPSVKETAPDDHRRPAVAGPVHGAALPPGARGPARLAHPGGAGDSSTLISSKALLNGSEALARCFVHTMIPTGNERDPGSAAHHRAAELPGAVPVRGGPGRDLPELRRQRPLRRARRRRRL